MSPDGQNRLGAYLARESLISVLINCLFSAVFFFIVFGGKSEILVWGLGAYAFDFIPQSFMVAFLSVLIPGLLAQRAVRNGKIAPLAGSFRLPRNVIVRALLAALLCVCLGEALAAGLFHISGARTIERGPALLLKLAYGGVLALIVTPVALLPSLQAPSPQAAGAA